MSVKNYLVFAICLIALNGCASMSKSECANANWELRGLKDGQEGSPLSLLSRHAKACAKVDVFPNQAMYLEGHAKGARLYCTPRNGLSEGRDNQDYNDVCPIDLEASFLSSFIDGLELKASEIQRNESDAESKLYRLRLQRASIDGPAPKSLTRDIERQEDKIASYNSDRSSIRLRIAEMRLKMNAAAR
jgi:hypothetical protein